MSEYLYEDLWLNDSVHKDIVLTDGFLNTDGTIVNATVTITNQQIDSEAFEWKQMLNAGDQLRFGSVCSDQIRFTMHENIPSLIGKTLNCFIYADNNPASKICLGQFTIAEDKLTADRTRREVVGYDELYTVMNTDVSSWYKNFFSGSGSHTLYDMLNSFRLEYINCELPITPTGNWNMTVTKTIEPDTLSGADVLRAIYEVLGCFGHIDNRNAYILGDETRTPYITQKLSYKYLSPGIDDGLFPSDTLYPANDLYPQDVNPNVQNVTKQYYTSVEFEDYNSEGITQLVIKTDDSDVGVTVGTAGNTYVIQNNFLLYGKSANELNTIGTNILNVIKNCYYRPAKVECIGNPCKTLGTPIRVSTTYRGIVTYILERTMKGVQALKDVYSAKGEQYYNQNINSIASRFQQLEGRTLKIKADVDGVETEVSNLASQTSTQISQLSDRINLKVSQGAIMSGLASETAYSAIEIMPNKIAVSSSGTFTVDSSNFKLTSSGYCEMGNCMIKGGTISLGTSGSTQLWIDLDRGFQMSDGSNLAYLQEGYLSITAYHAYGDRILRFDNNGLTLSDNAVVTVSELNVPNGGVGASKTQRSIYWRKASSLGNDEYVLCGEHV